MIQIIQIPGYLPPSDNELKRHWGVRQKIKSSDKATIAAAVMVHGTMPASTKRKVSLYIVLPAGKRRSDKTNNWKIILDSLVAAGALVDDSPNWFEPGYVSYARDAFGDWFGTFIVLEDM